MELSATSDNVLTRLSGLSEDEWIRLGKLSKTLNELWKISSGFDLDGDTHDWGDGVSHDLDAMGIFVGREGSLLDEELIDSDKTDGVTTWDVRDSLDLTSHHENSSLDVLDVEVGLASWLVVWSHNSDLLSGGDGTREDTSESVESTLIVGWDHLGDEDHEWTVLVTLGDGLSAWILNWSFVKVSSSVLLGLDWGWELHNDHLKKSLSSVNPLLVDVLEKSLSFEGLLISLEVDIERLKHFPDLIHVSIHNVSAKLDDWLHDELDEASWEGLSFGTGIVGLELLLLWVEVVVTPEFLHELESIELEFGRVGGSELGESEGPSEKSGSESDGTVGWVDLLGLTHIIALVGGDDNVGVLNNSLEVLVHGLSIDLELENTTIDLVDHHNWLNLLSKSLSEDSLSLDTNTFDIIDDDKSSISNTKGSSDLR